MGAGRVYSYSQTTSPHPPKEREKMNESHSSISRRCRRMVGWLKSKLKDGKKEKGCQGKRGRGVTRLERSASCKFSKAKTQDKKLYHRFPPGGVYVRRQQFQTWKFEIQCPTHPPPLKKKRQHISRRHRRKIQGIWYELADTGRRSQLRESGLEVEKVQNCYKEALLHIQ